MDNKQTVLVLSGPAKQVFRMLALLVKYQERERQSEGSDMPSEVKRNKLKDNILRHVRTYPKPMLEIADALPECMLRWSANGVPHAVKTGEGSYSVCWMDRRGRFYRVFQPYPSEYGERQYKHDFATVAGVVEHLKQGRR
ncbi:MAG: hypothetical protein ACUZ8A_06445 [Candidatus Bathyanammoxibius sp.]